jgi:hypothetical protein
MTATGPESANAATAPSNDQAAQNLAPGTPSFWQSLLGVVQSLANLDPNALAQAWGLWAAARASIQTVASGIAEVATFETIRNARANYAYVPLTPAVLADMVVRNILPNPNGGTVNPQLTNIDGHDVWAEAAFTGVDEQRMNALILDTGEGYGILDALRLYNRGGYLYAPEHGANYETGTPLYVQGASEQDEYGISETELDTVIYYSRVRDQFIPDLLKLSKNTLTPADAVEVAVKQIMSTADATNLYAAAGGIPEQFQMLVDAAGDSAGVEKAVELAAHGVIDSGQLRQIIAMSRLNPRFYYLAGFDADGNTVAEPYEAPFNQRWLAPYEIREAAMAGQVSQADALTWMLQQGYPQDQAQAFTGSLSGTVTATAKQETESMVLAEYSANLLSEAQATTALSNLGYTATAIPFLLQYAQAKAVLAARNTAVARVRSGFLLGLVSHDTANAELGQIGVPAAAITTYLADWTAELAVPHTNLSTAEIGKLLKDGAISTATASSLWAMRGYTQADIGYLEVLYPPPAPS